MSFVRSLQPSISEIWEKNGVTTAESTWESVWLLSVPFPMAVSLEIVLLSWSKACMFPKEIDDIDYDSSTLRVITLDLTQFC